MTKTKLRELAAHLKASEHSDCRSFLAALYTAAKQADPSYSYARLSTDLGLGSTNAHGVIHAKRSLTEKAGKKICEALALTGIEKRYFLALIRQERARDATSREAAFAERLDLKRQVLPNELSRAQLAFFGHWYHAAILELLRLPNAKDDADWIAGELRPAVPTASVRESLELLCQLGYLVKDPARGRLYPTEATITTGNEVRGLALASYHRQMLDLAVRALDGTMQSDRDISAITVAVTPALFEQMKDEIIKLRKRFLALADDHATEADRIYQLNLQLFPLAHPDRQKS